VHAQTPSFLNAPYLRVPSQKKVVQNKQVPTKPVAKKLPNIDKRLTPFIDGMKALYMEERECWVKNSHEKETWLPHWMELEREVYGILEDVPASAVGALAQNKPVPVASAVRPWQLHCQLATASMF
jgi:hypothetical protein